jgi:hypothetical protein
MASTVRKRSSSRGSESVRGTRPGERSGGVVVFGRELCMDAAGSAESRRFAN